MTQNGTDPDSLAATPGTAPENALAVAVSHLPDTHPVDFTMKMRGGAYDRLEVDTFMGRPLAGDRRGPGSHDRRPTGARCTAGRERQAPRVRRRRRGGDHGRSGRAAHPGTTDRRQGGRRRRAVCARPGAHRSQPIPGDPGTCREQRRSGDRDARHAATVQPSPRSSTYAPTPRSHRSSCARSSRHSPSRSTASAACPSPHSNPSRSRTPTTAPRANPTGSLRPRERPATAALTGTESERETCVEVAREIGLRAAAAFRSVRLRSERRARGIRCRTVPRRSRRTPARYRIKDRTPTWKRQRLDGGTTEWVNL